MPRTYLCASYKSRTSKVGVQAPIYDQLDRTAVLALINIARTRSGSSRRATVQYAGWLYLDRSWYLASDSLEQAAYLLRAASEFVGLASSRFEDAELAKKMCIAVLSPTSSCPFKRRKDWLSPDYANR